MLSLFFPGNIYLSSASTVKTNQYVALQVQDGTPSKHGSVCSSAALFCINRCGGKRRRAKSLRGVGGLLLEASQLQPPAQGQDAFHVQALELAVLPERGCSLLSSTLHPHPLFLGMLSGWLRHLTFARANISRKHMLRRY